MSIGEIIFLTDKNDWIRSCEQEHLDVASLKIGTSLVGNIFGFGAIVEMPVN